MHVVRIAGGVATLVLVAACGGGDSAPPAPGGTISFSSGSGIAVAENVIDTGYVARASSTDGSPVRFALSGGADRALFSIGNASGSLSFRIPPDYESPRDANADNDYVVVVSADSWNLPEVTQTVTISVTDVVNLFDLEVHFPTPNANLGGAVTESLVTGRVMYEDPLNDIAFLDVNGRFASFDLADRHRWSAVIPLTGNATGLNLTLRDSAGNQRQAAQTLYSQPTVLGAVDMAFDAINGRLVFLDKELAALIAVDPDGGSRVVLSDAATGTGPLWSNPGALALDIANGRAYVTGQYVGLVAIDLASGDRATVTDSSTGGEPHVAYASSIVIDADRNRALVLSAAVNISVIAVDLDDGGRTLISGPNRGTGPALPGGAMTLDAPGNRVFVTDGLSLIAVDLDTGNRSLLLDQAGGSGPAATFIVDLTFDPDDFRVFMSDRGNRAIVVRDLRTGDRSVIANDTTGAGSRFSFGLGAIAPATGGGTVYVFDEQVQSLYAVDSASGDRALVAEPTGTGLAFGNKSAIALDPAGNRLLAVDSVDQAGRVIGVDLRSGNRTLLSGTDVIGGTNAGSGRPLEYPRHVAVDRGNNRALVTDWAIWSERPSLLAVDLDSGDRTVISDALRGTGPSLTYPGRIALDLPRNLAFVVNDVTVLAIDLATGNRSLGFGAGAGSGPAIEFPEAIAVDADNDRAYVVGGRPDGGGGGLYRIGLAEGQRFLVSPNAAALGPQINFPKDIALDLPGNRALVTDSVLEAVVAVDLASGQRTIVADADSGTGPALQFPMGIALDADHARAFLIDRNAVIAVELSSGQRAIVSK